MTNARHGLAVTTVAAWALLASSCRGVPEPVAQAPAEPPAAEAAPSPAATPIPIDAPALELIQGDALVMSGGRPLPDLPSTLSVGDAIEIGDGGLAVLRWEPGLRAELLSGGRAQLEAGTHDRTARLVQSAGIARYTMAPAAQGAALDVDAGAVALRSDEPADVIVGFDPDVADATWVYVVDGAVSLTGQVAGAADRAGEDEAAGEAGDGDAATGDSASARLTAGHAVVFTRDGQRPVALPIELPAIEAWYASALAGTAPTIARASFRCAVRADAQAVTLQALPPTMIDAAVDPAGTDGTTIDAATAPGGRAAAGIVAASAAREPLAPRTLVEVTGRDEPGEWLRVSLVADAGAGTHDGGWLSTDDLDCVGPIAGLPVLDAAAVAAAPVADAAPKAAPTPGPASFATDRTTLVQGDCALLTWDIPVGTAVTLNGNAVAGKGVERTCPEALSSYRLAWTDAKGNRQERVIQVTVEAPSLQASADQGDQRRGGQSVPVEPTPCGTECVQVLPTLEPEPTRRPRPTPTVRPEPSSPPPAPTADPGPAPTSARPDPTRPPDPGPGDPTQPSDPGVTPTPTPTDRGQPTQPPETGTPAPPETQVPGTPTPPDAPDPGTPTPPGTPDPGPGAPTQPPTSEP